MESNSLNPYKYEKEGVLNYRFETKDGMSYRVYFICMSYLTSIFEDVYSLNIEPVTGDVTSTHLPYDARIGMTIVAILTEFFKKNANSMLMVCDNTDGREGKRRILFDRWYETYSNNSLVKLDAAMEDNGYRLFVSMYINRTNPRKRELVDAFNEIVKTDLYGLSF